MAPATASFRRHILVFDLDGTLIDSAPDITAAVNGLFAELGLPAVSVEHVRRMVGDGAPVLLQRALAHVGSPLDAAGLYDRYMEHYGENAVGQTTLYPGVAAALAELAQAGCRMGVCTNKPIAPTKAVLAAFGLDGYFGSVIGGDSLPQRKPDPEPLRHVIRQLGGAPEEAVLIGDSAVDLACAEAASVPAIIIPSGYGMAPPDAPLTIAGFADLPATLRQL